MRSKFFFFRVIFRSLLVEVIPFYSIMAYLVPSDPLVRYCRMGVDVFISIVLRPSRHLPDIDSVDRLGYIPHIKVFLRRPRTIAAIQPIISHHFPAHSARETFTSWKSPRPFSPPPDLAHPASQYAIDGRPSRRIGGVCRGVKKDSALIRIHPRVYRLNPSLPPACDIVYPSYTICVRNLMTRLRFSLPLQTMECGQESQPSFSYRWLGPGQPTRCSCLW